MSRFRSQLAFLYMQALSLNRPCGWSVLANVRFVGKKVERKNSANPRLAYSGFEKLGPDLKIISPLYYLASFLTQSPGESDYKELLRDLSVPGVPDSIFLPPQSHHLRHCRWLSSRNKHQQKSSSWPRPPTVVHSNNSLRKNNASNS